ncbi:MAG TPA: hypothetical protein VGI19_15205 [Candidatus Cybelea sp.]|jgi:hypothetical protein
MKRFNVAFVAALLLVGSAAALSSVNIVGAATKVLPNLVCNSGSPCRTFTNHGGGGGVAGIDTSSGPGISGSGYQGPGVSAHSTYDGIDAVSTNLDGGYFNGGYDGVDAVGSTSSAFPIVATNSYTGGFMEEDQNGNVYATGQFIGGALRVHHRNGAREIATYSSESTQSTLEDVGTGRMMAGRGIILLDPAFAAMIDASNYYVFLTPKGNNRGLYIAREGPRGFEVRESEGGRSTLAFDYRIVGQPIDEPTSRLPAVTFEKRPPHPMRPPNR